MKNQISKIVNSTKPAVQASLHANTTQPSKAELGALHPPLKLSSSTLVKIDHATMFDNIAVVSGWATSNAEIKFEGMIKTCSIARPDVNSAIDLPAIGFISVILLKPEQNALCCNIIFESSQITVPVKFSSTAEEITASMNHFALHCNGLMEHFTRSRLLSTHLAKTCQHLPHNLRADKRTGHIDIARTFRGFGYAVFGWTIKKDPTEFWVVTGDNQWHSLDSAVRFPRVDVADAFADTFGLHAAEAGFFCIAKNPSINDETSIRLVVAIDGGLFIVHEMGASIGPRAPISYAKWAFALSTPPSKFFDRLDSFEGELIEHLIAKNRSAYPDEFDLWKTSNIPSTPKMSVIVPLFGRSDFVEYQLTQFAHDPDFKNGDIELIYVIDDPKLVEPLVQSYHQLYEIYGVPFQLVWGKINRGYSGANNLGLKIARGETVILLNSDVFPIHSNWATRMHEVLHSTKTIGAVGARLEYADGSVQHQGMSFEYSHDLKVWLNQHPMRGFDLPPRAETYDVEATTGACLAVRRDDLIGLGGMDEGFLVGDFEDSDLCLRIRSTDRRIVIASGTRLVHLERQSFTNLGTGDFRTSIVKFNAWRHNRQWGSMIASMKEKS